MKVALFTAWCLICVAGFVYSAVRARRARRALNARPSLTTDQFIALCTSLHKPTPLAVELTRNAIAEEAGVAPDTIRPTDGLGHEDFAMAIGADADEELIAEMTEGDLRTRGFRVRLPRAEVFRCREAEEFAALLTGALSGATRQG